MASVKVQYINLYVAHKVHAEVEAQVLSADVLSTVEYNEKIQLDQNFFQRLERNLHETVRKQMQINQRLQSLARLSLY